jgi:predicted GIY-YIG superfamily endonuclease
LKYTQHNAKNQTDPSELRISFTKKQKRGNAIKQENRMKKKTKLFDLLVNTGTDY